MANESTRGSLRCRRPQGFCRTRRIRYRSDFRKAFRRGRRLHGRSLQLIVRSNHLGISRLGISVSKKMGDAVSRNQVKRYIREVFRKTPSLDALSIDVVVVVKSPADSLDYHEIEREFRTLLSRWA